MEAVRCFIGKSQNKWDENLQQIAGAIRSSVNRSTGFTPNKLMLGREVNIPAQLMFPNVHEKREDMEQFVSNLVESITNAHEVARSNLKSSLKRMKRNYDLRVLLRPYKEGDAVYLMDSAVLKGKCRKLCSPWKGPAVIVRKISAYLYQVKLRNSCMVVNHDRMMPCKDRVLPVWLKQEQANLIPGSTTTASDGDTTEYCVCRKPWEGRFMIQCDFCDEWYHGSCVNISATDALTIDKYKCSGCRERK